MSILEAPHSSLKKMGVKAAEVGFGVLNGEEYPKEILLDVDFVDSSNVDEFLK